MYDNIYKQIYKLTDKIKSYSELKHGWDGYDAKVISNDIIKKAFDELPLFVKHIKFLGFKLEDIAIVPVPNGNIQFEVENDKQYYEYEVR